MRSPANNIIITKPVACKNLIACAVDAVASVGENNDALAISWQFNLSNDNELAFACNGGANAFVYFAICK